MAREGITFEQVKTAAEQLVEEGREPSIRAVRERLRGTGSPNTIHRHLVAWRASRPDAPSTGMMLPESIAKAINDQIHRAAVAARAEVGAQLAQAMTDASDLAIAGEALEAERNSLMDQLATLTSERDVLKGKCAEQGEELARLRLELRAEQDMRGRAEREQAAAEINRDNWVKRLEESLARERAAKEEVSQCRQQVSELLKAAREAADQMARYRDEGETLRLQLADTMARSKS